MADINQSESFDDDIRYYKQKAREKVLNIILQKKKLDLVSDIDKANSICDFVCKKTESIMYETYAKDTGSDVFSDDKEYEYELWTHKRRDSDSVGYDFLCWVNLVTSIPFYQSLGDTIGFRNGLWEHNNKNLTAGPEYANEMIAEFIHLGGINKINLEGWRQSDDSLLYFTTLRVLSEMWKDIPSFAEALREAFLDIWDKEQMIGRSPGVTTVEAIEIQRGIKWDMMHYNPKAVGNGGCMRTGCIGIICAGRPNRKRLIALSVENSRLTHNSTISILGSITTALFTSYAIEKVPVNHWPHKLIKFIDSGKIDKYMKESRPAEYSFYQRDKSLYRSRWADYVAFRFDGLNPRTNMRTMQNPVLRIRDLSERFSRYDKGNPGGCADDACIIAYDAVLESGDNIEKLLVYSILHHGDSDTVGSIAYSWFGAFYHSKENHEIIKKRLRELEGYDEIVNVVQHILTNRLTKTYNYDLFVHYARKVIRRMDKQS